MIHKSTILILITLFLCLSVKSQDNNNSYVPLSMVKEPPIYPGCEGSSVALKKCFISSVKKLFTKKFGTYLSNQSILKQGRYKVKILFQINAKGSVDNITVRVPHKSLKRECIKVLNTIPKMIPSELKGKKVIVQYATQYTFEIE